MSKFSLKDYNSFGIEAFTPELIHLQNPSELEAITNVNKALILGGGSNVLFHGDLGRTVIVNKTKGILTSKKPGSVLLEVASGENWHELVMYCVENDFGGIENLSLIPGSVGAAPMQNIGAYGVEIADVLEYVDAIDLQTFEKLRFDNESCKFGYRESIFKKEVKGKYFISSIGINLTTENHNINTSYGAIQDELNKNNIVSPSIADVSNAVIAIRRSKLPDPKELGNAGSFFKNPIIEKSHFEQLQQTFPQIRSYPVDDLHVKVPAGWLIESLGWKGKRVGQTGSHKDQALVLVNYGSAKGEEIYQLSEQIKKSVFDKYNIHLETEVNIIT